MFVTCAKKKVASLLFGQGQHPAMVAVQASFFEGERLFAFSDVINVVCAPSRVGEVYLLLQRHLLEQGKTKVWNARGSKPPVADVVTARARENQVWRGDPTLDVSRQSSNVFGVPVGHPQHVAAQLNHKGEKQCLLFERIPCVIDVQIAWLFDILRSNASQLLVEDSPTRIEQNTQGSMTTGCSNVGRVANSQRTSWTVSRPLRCQSNWVVLASGAAHGSGMRLSGAVGLCDRVQMSAFP